MSTAITPGHHGGCSCDLCEPPYKNITGASYGVFTCMCSDCWPGAPPMLHYLIPPQPDDDQPELEPLPDAVAQPPLAPEQTHHSRDAVAWMLGPEWPDATVQARGSSSLAEAFCIDEDGYLTWVSRATTDTYIEYCPTAEDIHSVVGDNMRLIPPSRWWCATC
jgi:hypothetical protein